MRCRQFVDCQTHISGDILILMVITKIDKFPHTDQQYVRSSFNYEVIILLCQIFEILKLLEYFEYYSKSITNSYEMLAIF